MMLRELLKQVKIDYPTIMFKKAGDFMWSPKDQTVYYESSDKSEQAQWSLLHELGHGVLGHAKFTSDFQLLKMEVEAWEEAKILAKKYSIKIDKNHIEDCIDTYRDWLHLRSKCPKCNVNAIQSDPHHYTCHNCGCIWKVSTSRFCRIHRRSLPTT